MDTSTLASIATFAAYFIVMIAIGIAVYNRTKSLSDFVLGGRKLNSWVAALSANASDFSAWLLLGLPGAIYLSGLGEAWIAVGLGIGFAASWWLVSGRLRVYTERVTDARSGGDSNSLTLSSYLENRFADRSGVLRLVSAVLILLFYLFYVASGLVAMGGVFQQAFGISSAVAIVVGVSIVVLYTFLGGFLAVSLTDVVQAAMMWIALLIVPIAGIVTVFSDPGREAGSFSEVLGGVEGSLGDALAPMVIISGLAWGIGYLGQPHILARFMGIRSAADVRQAGTISVTWAITAMIMAVVLGFTGVVYFEQPLDDPEQVFAQLIQALLNPWVAGLLLAAILAAVMSTADSQLLVGASAVTEDGYRAFLKRDASAHSLVWISRGAVIAIAVLAAVIALSGNNTIMGLVGYAWAGFGAGFGPVILLSLYWRGMNRAAALAGMIGGGATAILWDILDNSGIQLGPIAIEPLGTGLYAMVPAVIVSLIGIFVFQFVGRATPGMEEDFDRVEREFAGPGIAPAGR
ncbi:sodium/proline symporter PutP [Streptomonospora sp. PA3]|uniref:sodium/proline symporter PutP n=1 Tax=Streptomonospora sp. PA3 TaxID=2607326 RepID=UPI0012DD0B9B|nr:sodium/proline symporter PutP [Streptomonospora sp. PA3]MUL41369.1 sodium/proline symporter PutP [Streptomonospora sp. PA3]